MVKYTDRENDQCILRLLFRFEVGYEEYLPVKEVIAMPAAETILDFGQNQAGWMEFYNREPKGTIIKFEAGEILQKGCFYRDNLRQARAAFVYVSDGQEGWVRPHFTYFGYRYLHVSGILQEICPGHGC